MAYVFNNLDDDEQQKQAAAPQAPTLGGGAPAPSGGIAAGSALQPAGGAPKSNPAQKGTGFTNLNSWLDAGKGRDKQITETGGEALGQANDQFADASSGVRNATFEGKTEGVKNLFDAGNDDALKGMVDQKYTGPREVNYDPNAQQNVHDADALSNANTTGSVLAKPQIEQGKYTSGMQRLDSVLWGSDGASVNAGANIGKELGTFKDTVKTDKEALGKKVEGFDKAAADASAKVRDELSGIGSEMLKGIDARVKTSNDQELSDWTNKTARDADGVRDLEANGQKLDGWIAGSGAVGQNANRGNVATDQEISGLNRLGTLLGDDALKTQDTGDYTSGAWGYSSKPAEQAQNAHVPTYSEQLQYLNERFGGNAEMNKNFTAAYDELRAAYPSGRTLLPSEHAEIMKLLGERFPMYDGSKDYDKTRPKDSMPPPTWASYNEERAGVARDGHEDIIKQLRNIGMLR